MPSRSPDLLPIEHVWGNMGRRICALQHPVTTLDELRLQVQETWDQFSQQKIDNLIPNIPRRVAEYIRNDGGLIIIISLFNTFF
ncbi:DDE 3 domain containing protein [Asbolus verrucosus]|uniref:DDE 3 domain containing protein n=1 Tax=Asbolus verrucosus TaxID=1661398 RepID=A0A482VZ94_ASBVE|nr:DDE 3 domain containing protein [Asbolus verrucosus]